MFKKVPRPINFVYSRLNGGHEIEDRRWTDETWTDDHLFIQRRLLRFGAVSMTGIGFVLGGDGVLHANRYDAGSANTALFTIIDHIQEAAPIVLESAAASLMVLAGVECARYVDLFRPDGSHKTTMDPPVMDMLEP